MMRYFSYRKGIRNLQQAGDMRDLPCIMHGVLTKGKQDIG